MKERERREGDRTRSNNDRTTTSPNYIPSLLSSPIKIKGKRGKWNSGVTEIKDGLTLDDGTY